MNMKFEEINNPKIKDKNIKPKHKAFKYRNVSLKENEINTTEFNLNDESETEGIRDIELSEKELALKHMLAKISIEEFV